MSCSYIRFRLKPYFVKPNLILTFHKVLSVNTMVSLLKANTIFPHRKHDIHWIGYSPGSKSHSESARFSSTQIVQSYEDDLWIFEWISDFLPKNVLFLNEDFLELHTLHPMFLQFFEPFPIFQIIRIFEVLKIGLWLSDSFIDELNSLPTKSLGVWKESLEAETGEYGGEGSQFQKFRLSDQVLIHPCFVLVEELFSLANAVVFSSKNRWTHPLSCHNIRPLFRWLFSIRYVVVTQCFLHGCETVRKLERIAIEQCQALLRSCHEYVCSHLWAKVAPILQKACSCPSYQLKSKSESHLICLWFPRSRAPPITDQIMSYRGIATPSGRSER